MMYETISGATIVKNYSVLHVSGANVGNNWFMGNDYLVEFIEIKPKN